METNKVVPLRPVKRKPYMSTYANDTKGSEEMSEDKYITKQEFQNLEEKLDLKITVAVQPLEAKIDNLGYQIDSLPNTFENMLLKEREHQNEKRKETNRFIWGTIIIGIISIVTSIILHFI